MPSSIQITDTELNIELPYGDQIIYVFPQSEVTTTIPIRIRNTGNSALILSEYSSEEPITLNGSTSTIVVLPGNSIFRNVIVELSETGSFLAKLSIPHNATNVPSPYFITFNIVVLEIDENLVNRDAYEQVSQLYGKTRDNIELAVLEFFNSVYSIVGLNELVPEIDLLNPFYNSYQIVSDVYRNPTGMLSAVKTLNRHVLIRGGYTNLDAYLFDQGLVVPRSWQTLSRSCGFSISNDFVED